MKKIEMINKIISGCSVRLRESYFIKNFPDLLDEINHFCSGINDISFKEKVWYWVNDIKTEYLCSCSSRTSFNKNWMHGYRKYCSPKCAQSDSSTKEKRKNSVIEKYGVDNIAKLEEVKKKQEKTNIDKYGSKSSFQNESVRKKWRDNIYGKYGKEHVFQLKHVKEASMVTSVVKYGKEHYVQSELYKAKLNEIGFSDKLRLINFNKHVSRYADVGLTFIKLYNRVLTMVGECGHKFDIHYDSLKRRIENGYECCVICNPINSGQSQEEKVLIGWLKSMNVNLIEKDRRFGIELDIFIPDKKIAIEFNGLYWHSEIYKDKMYHLHKSSICAENGVRLIHIWEDDWLYKQKIIKSILLNALGLIDDRIYSRKCDISLVSNKQKDEFLDNNHIQGRSSSSINIALKYNGDIVSLMTFGNRTINNRTEFELIRFCNKINTVVVGSASKLFSYFVKNYNYETITSFADISCFSGDLYKLLGFNYKHRSDPNYWWVVDGIRYHRFTYNKKRLIGEGADYKKTEVEIMYSKGHYRVFGCGQDKYIFKK